MLRIRKILFFTVYDFWFDKDDFIKSKKWITILNTSEKIDIKYYSIQITGKTFILNLTCSLEEILNHFEKKSLRYPISKAERDGIKIVHSSSVEMVNQFYQFLYVFTQKKNIPTVNKDELKEYDLFHAYSPDGKYIGGCAFLSSGDKSIFRYKHGATSYSFNENDLLLWNAIKYAKEAGYSFFDLGGVLPSDNLNDYYHKHYKYKKKFGGDLVDFYSYIKVRGILVFFIWILNPIVKIFFKNNYTELVNLINKIGILR